MHFGAIDNKQQVHGGRLSERSGSGFRGAGGAPEARLWGEVVQEHEGGEEEGEEEEEEEEEQRRRNVENQVTLVSHLSVSLEHPFITAAVSKGFSGPRDTSTVQLTLSPLKPGRGTAWKGRSLDKGEEPRQRGGGLQKEHRRGPAGVLSR
ncbi:unnamed protein product [Boreogadus saida]